MIILNWLKPIHINNRLIYKASFVFILSLFAILFLSVRDANAERGWGWLYPQSNASMIGVCSPPFDASVRFKLRDAVSHGTALTGTIKVHRRGIPGTVNFFGASNVVVTCYDPAQGYEIKVTGVSGHRNFYSVQSSFDPGADRGLTQRRFVYMARTSGSCLYSCPSVQSVSPSGSGAFQWFSGNPPSWRVRVRELPNQSGPFAIEDFLLNLQQTTNCVGLCVGYGDYIDRTGTTWAANTGGMLEHNITTKTNNSLNNSLGPLPSGRYRYTWLVSENGGRAWDPDSAFGVEECFCDWDEFGVDRVAPISIIASYAIQINLPCPNPTTPVEDLDKAAFCGQAQDGLSGLNRIEVFVKTGSPPSTSGPSNRVANCSYPSNPVNVIKTCPSSLLGPWSAGTRVFYNTCAKDRVGNRNCSGPSDFQVRPAVKPWLRTQGGNIGVLGLIFGASFIQDRNPVAPDPIPAGNYTSEYLMFAIGASVNERIKYNWLVDGYLINMEKFPQPSAVNSIYDTLFQKYSSRCVEDFTTLTAVSVKNKVNSTGCNILRYTPVGVAVIAGGSWANYTGKPVIIFLPNSATVAGQPTSLKINANNIKVKNKTGVIFVAKADINLKRTVRRIDGFFITDRRFVTDRQGAISPPDAKLVINGSVISFYSGGIDWRRNKYGRSLSSNNNKIKPAENIIYQPKYLWLFADTLGDSKTIFRELAP